jgi:threonine/homoserine/homoserine lactone efflux protein
MLAFLGVAAVVIATPGPDTALTVRNAVLGGRRAGVATALGVAAGQATWTVAASAGVAALLVASEPAFLALRAVGAAYLVWLGLQALLAAARPGAHDHARRRRRGGTPFRQGLLSNLANPKMAVFFTSLLPQFGATFAALLALGALFCAMTLLWLTAIACAGHVLARPRVRRAIDAVTGALLVALGVRLGTEPR